MAEIQCPNCGKPNPDTAEICEHCGETLGSGSDWMNEIREQAEGVQPGSGGGSPFAPVEPSEADQPAAEDGGLAEGEVPDWLQRIRAKQAAEEGSGDDFSALRAGFSGEQDQEQEQGLETVESRRPVGDEGPGGEDQGPGDRAAEPEDIRAGFGFGSDSDPDYAPYEKSAEPDTGIPSWLAQSDQAQPQGEAQPAGEAEDDQPEGTLPHVPALLGEQPVGLSAEELGVPDWLGEVEQSEQSGEETLKGRRPAAVPPPDLERATLPNWLEAMRPVDTFRSVVQIDAEDDQAVESVGPLAGLRGVLMAEPVVAMPRTSTVGAMQLEVSERQYAQAELLQQLIIEEESSEPAAPRKRIRLAFFRWAIAAVTVVAAALPVLTGAPSFALPGLEPKELGALFDLVDRLPPDRPALFVFDYDPGNTGELDAVAGALLDQVMSRGLPVASVSTRPTGSPQALHSMQRYASQHGYVEGSDMVHLGYLSGGPAAVQLFASNPRGAILKGFALPEEMKSAGQTAWDSPTLERVSRLSDFSMVAVITAGSETARLWVEQAGAALGDTPLVMVLSAAAEPLVRPYYEASQPQIDGILTGLPAAVAYEQRNGRFGLALDRWNGFGAGMLAAELVLLAGAGYGLVRWVMTRREV